MMRNRAMGNISMINQATIALCLMVICSILTCGGSALAQPQTKANAPEEKKLWQPYYISPRSGTQHLDLSGEWDLAYRDAPINKPGELQGQSKWLRAQVPSTVQMALHHAGELPHPYYNLNSEKYKWVDEKVWYYRKNVDVPQSARGNRV